MIMVTTRKPTAKTPARTPRTTVKKETAPVLSLDALLENEDGGAPDVTDEPNKTDGDKFNVPDSFPDETDENDDSLADEEIARLEAKIAEANRARLAPKQNGRPVAETELTPKQKKIRELNDRLAQAQAAAFESGGEVYEDVADDDELRVIHFVAEGWTAQGRVWQMGDTVGFAGEAYEQTKNKVTGESWLDLDDTAQIIRYGKVFFRTGRRPADIRAGVTTPVALAPVIRL